MLSIRTWVTMMIQAMIMADIRLVSDDDDDSNIDDEDSKATCHCEFACDRASFKYLYL